jgi:hypothetical protein
MMYSLRDAKRRLEQCESGKGRLNFVFLCVLLATTGIGGICSAHERAFAHAHSDLNEQSAPDPSFSEEYRRLKDMERRHKILFECIRRAKDEMHTAMRRLDAVRVRIEADVDKKRLDNIVVGLAEKELQAHLLEVRLRASGITNSISSVSEKQLHQMQVRHHGLEREVEFLKQARSAWTDKSILQADYVETLLLPHRTELASLEAEYVRLSLELAEARVSVITEIGSKNRSKEGLEVGH